MNADTTTGRGVARLFADFPLLPDLLANCRGSSRDIETAWRRIVQDPGCNLGHVEDEDVPGELPIDRALAEDAFTLSRLLHLVEVGQQPDGRAGFQLTEAGHRIANAASTPIADRRESHYGPVRETLAEQIREFWLGANDLPVADLLHDGAQRMAKTAHVWAGYCPGLLLVEFEALIYEADAEAGRDRQLLLDELVDRRDHAMHRHDMPSPDVEPFQNILSHADAVFDYYMNDLGYGDRLQMTVTEARATAMLLTYSGLLEDGAPLGPVQYLTPPR